MVSRYIFPLIFLLCACGSNDQELGVKSDPGAYVIDSFSGSLKGIHLGMSESELSSLSYPKSRGSVILEGDEYVTINVELAGPVVLECILDGAGNVYKFSTTSALVRDENGFGVGTPLHELKAKYPDGKSLVGDEDGRFASFVNGSKVIFSLDKRNIADVCFDEPTEKCEIDDKIEVDEVVVSRYAN